ncbi:hypothetical protein BGW80DRAFT_1435123 [Lactifluus volemus]|nr:hypothetical protein BGW80DRAFT_1435123 [Lactifluus volemus]
MSTSAQLDPYTANAQNDDVTLTQKIKDLHKIIRDAQTGMLTTRASNGYLHSRAMTPISPGSDSQLNLLFFANNASPKFQELENDSHVNVCFLDTAATHWASYSGLPSIGVIRTPLGTDLDTVDAISLYSIGAYYGDLGDDVHKGDENDPRVVIIEVVPSEVRYWLATSGAFSRVIQETTQAKRGKLLSRVNCERLQKKRSTQLGAKFKTSTGKISSYHYA